MPPPQRAGMSSRAGQVALVLLRPKHEERCRPGLTIREEERSSSSKPWGGRRKEDQERKGRFFSLFCVHGVRGSEESGAATSELVPWIDLLLDVAVALQLLHVLWAAEEQRQPLVQRDRLDGEDPQLPVGPSAAGVLRDVAERIGLVDQAEMVPRVHGHPAVHQGSMEVRDQGADVPRRVLLREPPLPLSHRVDVPPEAFRPVEVARVIHGVYLPWMMMNGDEQG